MRTMSLSEAREHMTDLADPIEKTVLTRKGTPVAVVLGIDAYRSYQALTELARDPQRYSQVMAAHIRVQQDDLSATKDLAELEELLGAAGKESLDALQPG